MMASRKMKVTPHLQRSHYLFGVSQDEAWLQWTDRIGHADELRCSLRWLMEAMYGSSSAGFGPLPDGMRYISPARDVVIIEQPPGRVDLKIGQSTTYNVYTPWILSVYHLAKPVEFPDLVSGSSDKSGLIAPVKTVDHYFSVDPVYTDEHALRMCALPLATQIDDQVNLFGAFNHIRRCGSPGFVDWANVITEGIATRMGIESEWKEQLYDSDTAAWLKLYMSHWKESIDSELEACDVAWPTAGITLAELIASIETASLTDMASSDDNQDYSEFFTFLHPLFIRADKLKKEYMAQRPADSPQTYVLSYQ